MKPSMESLDATSGMKLCCDVRDPKCDKSRVLIALALDAALQRGEKKGLQRAAVIAQGWGGRDAGEIAEAIRYSMEAE